METVIIIPNFNGEEHLRECLSSIDKQSYKNFAVIFIDDGSTDGSVQFIKNNFKDVEIISNKENMGFTGSINRGILHSIKKYSPSYIALLNNDTRVDADWLKNLAKAIESEDKIAGAASNMFFYDNPDIINSQGGMCNFIGIGKDINFGKNKNDIKKTQKYILSPCFGACMINVKYLDKIGLPDERYAAYCEDLDWGMRANILGYKIIFEKNSVVYHKGSSSYGKNISKKVYLCKRNSLCTIIKNYEAKKMALGVLLTLLYYPIFSAGQFLNLKSEKNISFADRVKCSLVPYSGILWNVLNLKETLLLRKNLWQKL